MSEITSNISSAAAVSQSVADDIESDKMVAATSNFFAEIIQYAMSVMEHGRDCARMAISRHKAAMELRQEGEVMLKRVEGYLSELSKRTEENPISGLDTDVISFMKLHNIGGMRGVSDDKNGFSWKEVQSAAVDLQQFNSGQGNLEAELSMSVQEAMTNNDAGTKMAKSFIETLKSLLMEIIQAMR